jgi:hypothetical protein
MSGCSMRTFSTSESSLSLNFCIVPLSDGRSGLFVILVLSECFRRRGGDSGHCTPAQMTLWSVTSDIWGYIVPPIDVSWKGKCVCKNIWSIREGLVVDMPLNNAKVNPVFAWRSSSPRDSKFVVVAQSCSLHRNLLKSPIIMTPRPANLSETAHFSAVCITYFAGLSGDCIVLRYSRSLVHMVYGPLDFDGTITCMMDKNDWLYVMRILVTNARPDESNR